MNECTKKRYHHKDEAVKAAWAARKKNISALWKFNVYRCEECRFDSGKRCWHWGHNRPQSARKARW